MQTSGRRRASILTILPFIICGVISGCGSESVPSQGEKDAAAELATSSTVGLNSTSSGRATPILDKRLITPGVLNPPTYSVDEVSIPDNAPLIGVVEGHESKAYLCSAMSLTMSHVVNDHVGAKPIFVTYCDRTDYVRVFSFTDPGKPPELKLAGFMNAEMTLCLNDVMYPQSSKDIPLVDREFVRTTWGEWKSEFPTTRVYMGYQKDEYLLEPDPTKG